MAVELAESGPFGNVRERRERVVEFSEKSRGHVLPSPPSPSLPPFWAETGAKLDSFPLPGQVRYKFQI